MAKTSEPRRPFIASREFWWYLADALTVIAIIIGAVAAITGNL